MKRREDVNSHCADLSRSCKSWVSRAPVLWSESKFRHVHPVHSGPDDSPASNENGGDHRGSTAHYHQLSSVGLSWLVVGESPEYIG